MTVQEVFAEAFGVATFTWPTESNLKDLLRGLGLDNYEGFQPIAAGSVNSNFSVLAAGKRWFLRLYEEQGLEGAEREREMLLALARAGVCTPAPVGEVGWLSERPAALFPWVEGPMRCQAAVGVGDMREVGKALAKVHTSGVRASQGRFNTDALRQRLDRIPESYPRARLRTALEDVERERDTSLPRGLVHGDVFRDNVLWDKGGRIAALLDFESAFEGAFAYDLAVTLLAWCYGDGLHPELVKALVSGYEDARPLTVAERAGLFVEARFAAVRFTITRITDYAMRPAEGRVMKDWRRFLARLDAVEALGRTGFAKLTAP